ncbi:MAG: hypothetical protein WD426_06505 [Anditalea sp.]
MNKDIKYYKFINSETGNVIYFLSFPWDEPNAVEKLEAMREKLAYENGIYIENIYYSKSSEKDFE